MEKERVFGEPPRLSDIGEAVADKCYGAYKAYQEKQNEKAEGFDAFRLHIVADRSFMNEVLSSDKPLRDYYNGNFCAVEEAFPFLQYQRLSTLDGTTGYLDIEDADNGLIRYEHRSPAGQDFSLNINVNPGMTDFVKNLKQAVRNFDPDEETMLWVGPDGHGINGAPYRLSDVLKDMKWCKRDAGNFINNLEKIISAHSKAVSRDMTEKDAGKIFMANLKKRREENLKTLQQNFPNLSKSEYERFREGFLSSVSYASEKTLSYENGNPTQLKELLNGWMKSVGINEPKPEIYEKCLAKELSKMQAKERKTKEITGIER